MATIVKPVEQKTKHLDYFLSQCHRRRYPAKSTIIYAGDKSDSLFYIVKGSVTITARQGQADVLNMWLLATGRVQAPLGPADLLLCLRACACGFDIAAAPASFGSFSGIYSPTESKPPAECTSIE